MARFGRLLLAFVRWSGWPELLARLPLPMLALAASWGVYSFALWFVPPWVAFVTAGAFELVYIGLAVASLSPDQQKRARNISLGAVFVSMAYNTLDGLAHLRPSLFADKPLWADVSLALLHGVPLALLAYLVADLLLHAKAPKSALVRSAPSAPSASSVASSASLTLGDGAPTVPLVSPGRPSSASLDDLIAFAHHAGEFSRADLLAGLALSASAGDRLLAEAIAAGRVVRSARGRYSLLSSS